MHFAVIYDFFLPLLLFSLFYDLYTLVINMTLVAGMMLKVNITSNLVLKQYEMIYYCCLFI